MNCFSCGKELEHVYSRQPEDSTQFDNALEIAFTGGYGMFVDPAFDPELMTCVVCHECAHELCVKVPFIENLIDSHNSHSHKVSYKEAHPDHKGWDWDREGEG